MKEDELISRKHAQTSDKKKAKKDPITGTGYILIMEDDDVIREALGEILTHLGYHIELAENGEEAIALYKTAKSVGQSFDLVIIDLSIHCGMGGKEAITKLREIDPNVKALVSSAYSVNSVVSDYKSYGFCGVVTKPYNIPELSEIISKLIDSNCVK